MKPPKAKKIIALENPSQIPQNMSQTQAAEFWDSHEITSQFLETTGTLPTDFPSRTASRLTSIRLDADLETRLRELASRKHKPYQTLLKDFVLERVYEEEKRLGIV